MSDIAELKSLGERLKALSTDLINSPKVAELSDEDINELVYAAAKLVTAKADRSGRPQWNLGRDALNATETVTLVTALLDAADINLFDLAIWYRRPS